MSSREGCGKSYLVTSIKNIALGFGPRARDQNLLPVFILLLDVWDIQHSSFEITDLLWIQQEPPSVGHLFHSFNKCLTNAHRYRRLVKSKPWKCEANGGWGQSDSRLCELIFRPLHYTSAFSVLGTRLLNCNPFVAHVSSISLRSLDVGVLGRQSRREAKREWRTNHRAMWKFFLFLSLRNGQLNMT